MAAWFCVRFYVVFGLGLVASMEPLARAEGIVSPLVEMRAAAEALATINPEAATRSDATIAIPHLGDQPTPLPQAALQTEIHTAVRLEVSREPEAMQRARAYPKNAKPDHETEGTKGIHSQARNDATQAQQARLSRMISEQRATDQPPRGTTGASLPSGRVGLKTASF